MNLAMSSESLLSLARSRQPADRERLLLAIADLCDAPHAEAAARSQPVQALLGAIFMQLVVETERDLRRRLAEKLATAAWAPNALINVLALDDIEIAAPIIAGSPVLSNVDLVRLLVEATIEHQIAVARRPELAQSVVTAILERSEPAVLTADGRAEGPLAAGDEVRIGPSTRRLTLIVDPDQRFYARLRSKLRWGEPPGPG